MRLLLVSDLHYSLKQLDWVTDERAAVWLAGARSSGVYVDGSRVETDQVVVSVCPWWDGPLTREVVDRALAADAAAVDGRLWIWAYHAPPEGSPTSWTGRRHYGDADVNAWIDRHHPDLVLCGHVHESPFADGGGWADRIGTTLVVNSGREPGPVPTHVVVDTDARLACWMSSEGVEERSFAPAQYSG